MSITTTVLKHRSVSQALGWTVLVSLLLLGAAAAAQTAGRTSGLAQGAALKAGIRELDAQLFGAFNRCSDPSQLERHASFFAPDVEFYHDNGGVTWTRDAMIANTRKNACGNYTRELVEETFDVSPIADFGALSRGTHRFCRIGSGRCEGEAEFLMLWRLENDQWQVTRAFSFNHRPAK